MRSTLAFLGVALVSPHHRSRGGPNPSQSADIRSGAGAPPEVDPIPQFVGSTSSRFSVGGFMGYQNGLSLQAFGPARDFAQGFPLQARFRLARTSVEPGSAPDARRIFINDATNGTPKEAGNTWDLGLDGLYPMGDRTHFFGGVRYTQVQGQFQVRRGQRRLRRHQQPMGPGGGDGGRIPHEPQDEPADFRGRRVFLLVPPQSGHDTSYSPDGDNVNPRKDYTYSDADNAVDQPVLRPVILLGFSYRLGR